MADRTSAETQAPEFTKLRGVFERAWRRECALLARHLRLSPALAPVAHALRAHLAAPGKRVRPSLLLGAWRAFSRGTHPPKSVVEFAVALELVHTFVLVHDDIVDCAESRRGEPTLHRRLERALAVSPDTGVALAIVAGDIAFNHAWEIAASADVPRDRRGALLRVFADTIHATGAGELLEIVNTARPLDKVTAREIARTYHAKTTRYTIEAPLMLGALLAGAPAAALRAIVAAAQPLGFAFQLENDAHEIAQLAGTGAPTDDLEAGVKTRPLRLLHDILGRPGRAALTRALANPRKAASRAQLAKLIRATDLRARLAHDVEASFALAARALARAPLSDRARAGLEDVFAFLHAHRHHSEANVPPVRATRARASAAPAG